MTRLEEVSTLGDDEIYDYLTSVSIKDFKLHVDELKRAYANRELLDKILETLQKLKD